MGFDVENFGIGLATGWITAYGVYRARHVIKRVVESAGVQASNAQNYATQSTDNRYINNIVKLVERNHAAGGILNLSEVLVEPRFIAAPPLVEPQDDDVSQSVFHVVPHVADFPALFAPYNSPTLSIDDLASGDRGLALLGLPGSGRTTAMMAILLRALGRVQFKHPLDKVQQRLDAEEAAMDEKKRAVRIKERLLLEQRAKERLAEEKGMVLDETSEDKDVLPLFNRLMPVYVHLADVNVRDPELGKEIDPAEPLVRAVQREIGRVAASTIPRNLYNRLQKGQVLLLIDGYDDLPESEQTLQLAWLKALISTYPNNFFIVSGPVEGSGGLTQQLGLTPVYMRPWSDLDMEQAIAHWITAWPQTGGRRRSVTAPDESIIQRVKNNNRGLSPLALTLKIWTNFANDTELPGLEGWMQALVKRSLPTEIEAELGLSYLIQAATLQLDEGYFTLSKLAPTAASSTVDAAEAETDAMLRELIEDEAKPQPKTSEKSDKNKRKEPANPAAILLNALYKQGFIMRYSGGRYQFRQVQVAAYLASLGLKQASADVIQKRSEMASWRWAMPFVGIFAPLDEVVQSRMTAATDVIQSGVMEMANWLALAPMDAAWRGPYLKYLSNVFVAPNQYPLLRERAAAALVQTQHDHVIQVFKQAAQSVVPQVRQLACLGLGALKAEDGVSEIIRLLQDDDANVQLAAALSLGAIGSEEALTGMVEAFATGTELLRQAVAETFADIPEEGYPVLYDAIQDDEMMLRRAAVFGLRRLKSDWAMIAIYRSFLEDSQWYVRSAAQIAFNEMRYGSDKGPRNYPPAEAITWLNEWATQRGENVPSGEGARQMLLKALQEGDGEIRKYAAANLGQLGVVSMTKPLYAALRDKKSDVREEAHRALAMIQIQSGKRLPTAV